MQASVCPSDASLPGHHLISGGLGYGYRHPRGSAGRDLRALSTGRCLRHPTLYRHQTRDHDCPRSDAADGGTHRCRQRGREGQLLPGPPAPVAGGGGFGSGDTGAGAARWAAGVGVRAQCHATGVAPGGPPRRGHALRASHGYGSPRGYGRSLREVGSAGHCRLAQTSGPVRAAGVGAARTLGAHVPFLLLTYGAHRIEQWPLLRGLPEQTPFLPRSWCGGYARCWKGGPIGRVGENGRAGGSGEHGGAAVTDGGGWSAHPGGLG